MKGFLNSIQWIQMPAMITDHWSSSRLTTTIGNTDNPPRAFWMHVLDDLELQAERVLEHLGSNPIQRWVNTKRQFTFTKLLAITICIVGPFKKSSALHFNFSFLIFSCSARHKVALTKLPYTSASEHWARRCCERRFSSAKPALEPKQALKHKLKN